MPYAIYKCLYEEYKSFNKDNYYELLKGVFEYLSNQDEDRKQWYALGSNQIIENNDFNFDF